MVTTPPRRPRRAAGRFALGLVATVFAVGAAAAEPDPAPASATALRRHPLRFGFVAPDRPNEAIAHIDPFRRRLADTLGLEVRVTRFADERALVDAFAAGRIDYAPFTASGYAMTFRLCGCVEPVGVPRAADGTAGWRSVVVVRAASPVDRPAALAGKTLATAGEGSIGGRRLPLRLLAAEGVAGPSAPVAVSYESPRAAMKAMLEGRADAAIAWSTLEGDLVEGYGRGTLHDMVAAGEVSMSDVRVVWSSPVLPHGPHAVRADLAEGPKRRLRDMLVDLDEVDPDAYEAVEPVFGGGFLRVGHTAYRPFVDLVTPPETDDAPVSAPDGSPHG